MAAITRAVVSADTNTQRKAPQQVGIAAATLAVGDLVYISSALNGMAQFTPASGAAANAAAAAIGIVFAAAVAGQPATAYGFGTRFSYAAAGILTPGARYYVSATTPGGVDAAATTGDAVGFLRAITDQDLYVAVAQ